MSNYVYNQVKDLHKRNPKRSVIELDSLDNFTCINNNILIKINPEEYESVRGLYHGDEGFLDEQNRYHPAVHAVRHGTVIKQPNKFVYHENGHESHRTTIETMVGDDVYFPVIESVNCPLVIYNEEYYLLMNYEVLYLAKRPCVHMDSANYIKVGDNEFEVTMLNGYLLCKTEEYDDTTPFRIEDRKVKDFKRVRIIFSGIPVEYRSNPLNSPPSNRRAGTCIGYTLPKGYPSNPEIKNGDIVLPMKSIRSSEVMLEDELHLNFDGKNMYRLLQRKYIDAIYEKNN